MRSSIRNTIFLTFLVGGVLSGANASQPLGSETKLIGAWADTYANSAADSSPEKLERARKAGQLHGVVAYNADHTFVLYPCGQRARELSALGIESPHGTWELREPDLLVLRTTVGGKSAQMEERLAWDGEQLIVSNGRSRMVKYPGKLPPSC